jgi:hypothetical protein
VYYSGFCVFPIKDTDSRIFLLHLPDTQIIPDPDIRFAPAFRPQQITAAARLVTDSAADLTAFTPGVLQILQDAGFIFVLMIAAGGSLAF